MDRYSYYPLVGEAAGRSPACLIDARIKVLLAGILSFAVWKLDSITGLGVTSALVGFWVILARGAIRSILSSLRNFLYIFLGRIL